MDRISGLPDELLVKILSFVPTQIAVSTSILSKRWGSLWKWVPKLDAHCWEPALVDFISKNLPLRATIIESLCLRFHRESFKLEDIKLWVGTAVSHCLRELSINYFSFTLFDDESDLLFPRSLYTCISLVTLELIGRNILVDVPLKGCLPSLKTLQLCDVTYSNQDSLRLLLSYCLVLENLVIQRDRSFENSRDADDNLRAIVVIVPSLQRLTLGLANSCTDDGYEIVTPSLKYLKFEVYADISSNMIASMPKLEEADINVEGNIEKLLTSVTSAKRLALYQTNHNIEESEYCEVCAGIVFDQLEQLKLDIFSDDWSSLLVWLLKNSPKLRVLNLHVDADSENFQTYESADWKENGSSAPKCLKRSLETLGFTGYSGRVEERDVLSFIFEHASCLKSISISHWSTTDS